MRAATWCPRTPVDKRAAASRPPARCAKRQWRANWIGRATSDPAGNGPPTVPGGSLPVARRYPSRALRRPRRGGFAAALRTKLGGVDALARTSRPGAAASRGRSSRPHLSESTPAPANRSGVRPAREKPKYYADSTGDQVPGAVTRRKVVRPGDFPLLAEDGCRQSPVRLRSPGISIDPRPRTSLAVLPSRHTVEAPAFRS